MLKKNFVVVWGTYNVNLLGDIRSFGQIGYDVIVLYTNLRKTRFCPKQSRYITEYFESTDLESGYKMLLDKFKDVPEKILLSAGSDQIVGFLNERFDEAFKHFVFFRGKDKSHFLQSMKKEVMCGFAAKAGLSVPRCQLVNMEGLDLESFTPEIDFPIFTKADDSFDVTWKDKASICSNIEELKTFLSNYTSGTVLLQEFIKKKNEYFLSGVSYDGGESIYMPVEGLYLRISDGAFGSWEYYKKYSGGDELHNKISALFKSLEYTGVFEIEFMVGEDDKLYFLEVNFRYTASHHLYTYMGINLSQLWADYEQYGHKESIIPELKKDPLVAMNGTYDLKSALQTPGYNIFKWLKDVHKTDVFYIWDRSDRKPFYSFLWSLVCSKICKS